MINKPRVTPSQIVVFITTLLASSLLLADGFRNPPEGARAVGAFGGHRAFADDANANIHNSANLVDLEQPMVQYNTTFGYGRTTFDRPGVSEKTGNPFFAIPGFSAAIPSKDGKYAAGLSLYVPYGRSVEWKDNGYFAANGMSYAGSMTVADLTPNFAMRLCDSLSIGIGADLYYGAVKQWTYVGPGVKSKLVADGQAIGWNAAMTWKMTEKQRLTATYRSPFKIKYTGNDYITGGTKSDVDATIEYPTIVGLAYGIQLTDTLRAEVNGEWLDFSQYESLTIHDPAIAWPVSQQRLKDTWTAGTGLAWNFKPKWTLRSGFMYLKNPTPNDTYGPLSPDEDQGVLSLGLGYEIENHSIDVGYAYGLFNGRTVSGNQYPACNGNYDYNVHLLSLSYGYKF
ncbi:MAG: outer membrane protein transport protein [Verrucomicrobia bacterium]|nr:outer membrane protein transport protein [Verrucomicrobiota bacterium]